MINERKKKLFEFNIGDIHIGKCKTIDTGEGTFKICRGKEKIEIFKIFAGI